MAEEVTDPAILEQLGSTVVTPPGGQEITDPAILQQLQGGGSTKDLPTEDLSWAGAVGQGIKHIPGSAFQFGADVIRPVAHPIETYEAFKNLGAGVLQKLGLASGQDSIKYADAAG